MWLLLLCAAVSLSGGNAGDWSSDNRLQVLGYTDSEGRHYPRGPPVPTEYHYPDNEVSNQISSRPSLPPAPYSSRSTWRQRAPYHETSGLSTKARPRKHQNQHLNQGPAMFRTAQRGSARIPHRGATVNVPAMESVRKMYHGSVSTTVYTPPQAVSLRKVQPRQGDAPASPSTGPCIRCPGDRAVVANQGHEMVLVEQPEFKACHHSSRFKLPELRMEWTQGPRPGTLAEEGNHVMVGRVMYRHRQLQVCRMKYHVIVRKCPPLVLPKYMLAKCSMGNIWGSQCELSCHQGFHLQGHRSINCEETLDWSYQMPTCEALSGCYLPMSPEHGRLSCKTPSGGEARVLPENTICRYECDSGYTVPESQSHLTVISCQSGGWNSTADPSCHGSERHQAEQPQVVLKDTRYRLPRRRHRDHRLRTAHRTADDPCQPNPCQEGGMCLRGPRSASVICLCQDHREGEFCERARCKEEMCENGGKCMAFGPETVCYCPAGYSGQQCQIKDSR